MLKSDEINQLSLFAEPVAPAKPPRAPKSARPEGSDQGVPGGDDLLAGVIPPVPEPPPALPPVSRPSPPAAPPPSAPIPIERKAEPVDWRAQVPTVGALTQKLRSHIEGTFGDTWVRGEISNLRKPVSGHAYFILKDANAQIRVCMFRPLLAKLKFQLKDGMEVLLHGKVTVYEAKGDYQIVGDTMEPVGAGALQLAFEQLKAKLQAEGLFDASRKKKLPRLPRRIGIVTSATGAAVRDILKVLSRRFPKREILVIPASVQGDKAAAEIVAALRVAERWNAERPSRAIDVLIVGRGGGSLEDMWCFNEEPVARAIAACPIPTISAVGHEIDFTIADFVADVRAPTPSAAAEMVVPRRDELGFQVETLEARLAAVFRKRLEQSRLHLGHLAQRLVDPRERIRLIRQNLGAAEQKLRLAMSNRLEHFRLHLGHLRQRVKDPRQRLPQLGQNVAIIRQKLEMAMRNRLRLRRQKLAGTAEKLHALSPLAVLARGYSITYSESGELLQRRVDAVPGTRLRTRLADGEVHSVVLPPDAETK